jgi:hypothetical protein
MAKKNPLTFHALLLGCRAMKYGMGGLGFLNEKHM